MANTDDEPTPVAPLAVTEPAPEPEADPEPEEPQEDAEPEPTYRLVSGFGVAFSRDITWPNRYLGEAAWDTIRDDLSLHGGVEVFEYLPPALYKDDPEGPLLVIAVSGSLVETQDLTGVIRELPKYDGSWPIVVQAALDVLKASNPVLAEYIKAEPMANLKPGRFILVEEAEDDDDEEAGDE